MTPRPLVRWTVLGLALLGSVTCDPPFPSPHLGKLIVSTATAGVDTDPDGYEVILDDQSLGMIAPNGAITLDTILSGRHSVTLDSVATNCGVAAPLVREVQVPREDSAVVAFGVFCRIRIGSVLVTVATTGPDPDVNGYRVAFDSGPAQPVARNGPTLIGGLHEGVHTVTVSDVAPNCSAAAPVPDSVAVAYDSTSHVSVNVTCRLASGILVVTVSTTGTNLDPDGYVVRVDGLGRLAIGLNGVWTLSGVLADALHDVDLGGVASNCGTTPAGAVPVVVAPGDTVRLTFTVDCWSPGAVAVTATTTGVAPDPNGYSITLERPGYATTTSVSANGTAVVGGLQPGPYALTIDGLANNCAMASPPADTVTVLSGDTTAAAFTVACTSTLGSLRVITATTGSAPDSNGYLARVDEYCDPYYGYGCSWLFEAAMGVNDTVTFANVPIGGHVVTLSEVAPNCVPTSTFASVTVTGGDTATAAFAIRCDPPGAIEAIITTQGPLLDQDGYGLLVTGPGISAVFAAAVRDTIVISGLAVADHELRLISVDPNCAVTPPNPRTVTVISGVTTQITFQVTCVQPGALVVSVTTTGPDPDPDGYVVQVNRPGFGTAGGVPANGAVLFENLQAGVYDVALASTSANCTVTPPNPRTVTVLTGDTAGIGFGVTCVAATRLAYASNQGGNEDVYTVLSNGADVKRLTTHPSADAEPTWSPDGTRVAFVSRRDGNAEIYVMDLFSETRLTNAGGDDIAPAWSPDGTKLAFVSTRDGNREIYVMGTDGSNPVRLTNVATADESPAWSPDGSKIAFATDRDGNFEIYAMNADGSAPVRLTTNAIPDLEPDWSPDGARIAFTRFAGCGYYFCDYDIWVMNADGSGATVLVSSGNDIEPAWSPDGTLIALTRRFCDDYYGCSAPSLVLRRADGAEVNLVYNAYQPAWRR